MRTPSVFVLVVALFCSPLIVNGQSPPVNLGDDPVTSLQHLAGVLVVVEGLNPQTGLTGEQLARDVEQWLRQAGVRPLTTPEYATTAGQPALYVNVQAIEPPAAEFKGVLLFSVHAAVYQRVTLQRDVRLTVLASTWEADLGASYADQGVASTFIRTGVRDLIDRFLTDHREANTSTASTITIPPTVAQIQGKGSAPSSAPPTEPKRLLLQNLDVRIVDRQTSVTNYSYVVPGNLFAQSNSNGNCFGAADTVNCTGSTSTTTSVIPPRPVSYNVRGATFTLRLPDGRLVIVNCESKYKPKGDYINRRNCRMPLVDDIKAEFDGDSAKLRWPVSIDGKKTESETYKILAVLAK